MPLRLLAGSPRYCRWPGLRRDSNNALWPESMSIALRQFIESHYVWDCWYLPKEEGGFHAFMLAAERHHKDADVHDQHSELVYCTSPDLRTFEVVKACVLEHGKDESIWTGCTRRIGDECLLFHTVRQSVDGYWARQVIRLARSTNLRDWERVEGFDLSPEQFGGPESPFANQPRSGDRTIHSWRDPYVFFHAECWWMLVSATRKDAGPKDKACVTLLRADGDPWVGANWKLATPVLVAGYEELDVPQLYLDEQTGEAVLVASLFSEADYARSMERGYDPFSNPPHTKYRREGRLVGFRSPDLAAALAGRFLEPEKEQVLIGAGENLYAGVVVPELDGSVIGVDLLGGPPKLVERRLSSLHHIQGTSLNQFLVQAGFAEAQRVLERENLLRLSRRDAAKVFSLLDRPPRPNARLKAAVAAHRQKVRASD